MRSGQNNIRIESHRIQTSDRVLGWLGLKLVSTSAKRLKVSTSVNREK